MARMGPVMARHDVCHTILCILSYMLVCVVVVVVGYLDPNKEFLYKPASFVNDKLTPDTYVMIASCT